MDKDITLKLTADFKAARTLTQDNQYEQAVQAYEKILQEYPKHTPSHYNLAQLAAKLGDAQKAHQHFAQAIALEPLFVAGHFQLAQILIIENKPLEAIEQLEIAIALQPEYVDAQHLLACTALQQKQYELAQEHFIQLLKMAPDHASGHLNYALLKFQQKEIAHAKRLLDSALALDPTLVEAHYHLGVIAMQRGDTEQAILEMQETLDRQENHFAANYNLAILYKMQNHYQLAIHYLKKAHSLNPENESIQFLMAAFAQESMPKGAPKAFVQELFNHYAENYDTHMQQTLHYQVPQLLHDLLQSYMHLLPKKPVILDVGCGTGLSGEYFKDLDAQLIGIDLADEMLEQAKKRAVYTQLHSADIVEYLQQENNKFDLIIAADVFGYLGELDKIFKICEQTLQPEGLLLFSIELSPEKDCVLQSCARYAHSENYITHLTENWHLLAKKNVILRYQENTPVAGVVFLYQSRSASDSSSGGGGIINLQ